VKPITQLAGPLALLAAACAPAEAQVILDRTAPPATLPEPIERDDAPPPDAVAPPTDAAAAPDARRAVAVGAIALTGLRELTPADFVDIVADHAGRALDAAELAALPGRIAERARSRGYVFATASILPQTLRAGVLELRVDEGVLDRIELGREDAAVRAVLAPLADGRPVTRARLERQLLLAEDLGGVQVRRARYERQGDAGVLVVDARRRRLTGRILLTDEGTRPIGPEQAQLDLALNGLAAASDRLSLSVGATPFQPDELGFARLRYGLWLTPDGTQLTATASYSETRPGAYLRDRDIFGRSWRVEASLRHPLRRSRALSLWAEAEFEVRDLRQDRFDVRARADRVVAARAGLFTIARTGGGRLRARATLTQGLDLLGATAAASPLASRSDAAPDFTTLSGWFEWDRPLGGPVSLMLGARGQLASRPLLVTEELGLGGSWFLRGYNFNERIGDYGAAGLGELRYDWRDALGLVRRLQLYAFADGGVVANLRDGRGGGSLASAGAGVRADVARRLDLGVELAVPLTGPRYDSDDRSPRVNLRLSRSF